MAKTILLKHPKTGELADFPIENANAAIQGGYVPASADEAKDSALNEAYGNSPFTAGAEGFARGVSLGGSDVLERILGRTPEALKETKDRNPISSGVGEGAGVLAPAAVSLLAGPEAPAAVIASRTPVGLLSRAGAAAAESIAPRVAAGEGASVLARAAAQAIPHAVGSAVEGAGLGLGQSVSEEMLGDHGLNGEKLLANMGIGAVLGGTVGGALGFASEAVPAAAEKASEAFAKLKNTAVGASDEVGPFGQAFAKASSFVSGKDEGAILDALKNRAQMASAPELEHLTEEFANNLNDLKTQVGKASKETFKSARGEETSRLLNGMEGSNPELIKAASDNVLKSVDETLLNMQNEPALYTPSATRRLEIEREQLVKTLDQAETPAHVFQALDEFKSNLDSKIKWSTIPNDAEQASQDAIKGIRGTVKSTLEDQSTWGEAASRQSTFNAATAEHIDAEKMIRKDFMKKTIVRGRAVYEIDPVKVKTFLRQAGDIRSDQKMANLERYLKSSTGLLDQIEQTHKILPEKNFDRSAIQNLIDKNRASAQTVTEQAKINKTLGYLGGGGHNAYLGEAGAVFAGMHNPALGAGIETLAMLRNPGLAIQRLAKIESLTQKTTKAISYAAKGALNVGDKVARSALPKLTVQESLAAREKDEAKMEKIASMTLDPASTMDHMAEQLGTLQNHAPNTAGSLNYSAATAMQFLKSKIPGRTSLGPLSNPKAPRSPAQISKFMRYYGAIEDPVGVIKSIGTKTISPEAVEAIQTVYPRLYSEMKVSLMDEISSKMAKDGFSSIPYQTKLAISLFTREDMVEGLSQQSLLQNQMALQANTQAQGPNAMGQGSVNPTSGGIAKMEGDTRMVTPMQASTARMDRA